MSINYKCDRCDKSFNQKDDYERHLNRKTSCIKIKKMNMIFTCNECNKPFSSKSNLIRHKHNYCKPKLQYSITEDKILDYQNLNDNIIEDSKNKDSIINSRITNFSEKKQNTQNPHHHKNPQNLEKNECEYCGKKYSRSDSLKRHLKNKHTDDKVILKQLLEEMKLSRIEINEKQDRLLNKVELIENENLELKNEIKQLKEIKGDTINSNNTNTQINNHFNIVPFGKEKLDEIIGEEECKKILFRGFEAVPQLIENVHFNQNRPEYHNCYIPNIRGKYAIVYDGKNWKLENSMDIIEILTDNNKEFLERKFEDFYDSLDSQTKKNLMHF